MARLSPLLGWVGISLLAGPLCAQNGATKRIQDNSFLIEEAYNQEAGVVQHISLFGWEHRTGSWGYSFTQEWPLGGQRHQLSYSLSLLHDPPPGGTGAGDIFLNYRAQLLGSEGSRVWLAPRLSAILPTGSWRDGRGNGVAAFEARLPGSFELTRRATLHLNAGLTVYPSARAPTGARATLTDATFGASLIVGALPAVDLLLESDLRNGAEVSGAGETLRSTRVRVSPGVRWAHNLASGLQIVPGAAYTVGLGSASEESGLLLYLSFEHPLKRN